ncbi:hypothetical protein J2R98_000158 [Alkalibacillus filiformis]|uniref:Uncharacterized protein n=1 Tax=Alkalibacillus filiformis TaxID=200990 RepID=A0ABU0DPI6_9BACI|nr:hypothetical protein [Alkalibacillus filiformis]MDQ0350355.1 hypothetical protein [Alkalibacillus filiformis]
MKELITNLQVHTIECIRDNKLNLLEENLSLLKKIHKRMLEESKQPNDSKSLKHLINSIDIILDKLADHNFYEEFIDLVSTFYLDAITHKFIFNFNSAFYRFAKSLKYIDEENSVKKINFSRLLVNIYILGSEINDYEYNKQVSHLLPHIYTNIQQNSNLSELTKKEVTDNLIGVIFDNLYLFDKKAYEQQITLFERLVLRLLKAAIDEKDSYVLNQIWNGKFSNEFGELNKSSKIILFIAVYSYYLSEKETLVDMEHFRALFTKVLGKKNDLLLLRGLDSFWSLYKLVKPELIGWEFMPSNGEAKWMMMEEVLEEFTIFYAASIDSSFIDEIDNTGELQSLLFKFNAKEFSKIEDKYENFIMHFGIKDYDKISDLRIIYEELLDKYYEGKLQELTEWDKKLENLKYLEVDKENLIDDSTFLSVLDKYDQQQFQNKNKYSIVERHLIPVSTLNNEFSLGKSNDFLIKRSRTKLQLSILNDLINEGLQVEEVIREVMFYYPEEFVKDLEVIINGHTKEFTHLFSSGINWRNLHFNKRRFEKFNKQMRQFTFISKASIPGLFLFNKNDYTYHLNNFTINYRKLNTKELHDQLKEYRIKEGYRIPILNNHSKELSLKEAKDFLKLNNRILESHIDLYFFSESVDNSLYIKFKNA